MRLDKEGKKVQKQKKKHGDRRKRNSPSYMQVSSQGEQNVTTTD